MKTVFLVSVTFPNVPRFDITQDIYLRLTIQTLEDEVYPPGQADVAQKYLE